MTQRFDWRNPPKSWRICLVALVYSTTGLLAGGIVGMLMGGFLLGALIGFVVGAIVGASVEQRR